MNMIDLTLITKHDFPYSSSIDPVSSPLSHLLKKNIFYFIFLSDSTVLRKMDHFDISDSFVIWKLSRSRELTKPTLLDPDHFPGSRSRANLGGLGQSGPPTSGGDRHRGGCSRRYPPTQAGHSRQIRNRERRFPRDPPFSP